ncbi:hypothetical protein B5V01_12115 [Mesorhizobium erdmanii]|uniref:DUF680 domain-containing protein n=2 Tax=Mesorhizobium TaxID=68287 RepID=A0A3M9XD88_9HYPH|nr:MULTISPECIES: DUF680 domain-containing protein [Mesorhizobium]RNJ45993.1 hypothetical protein DNR46_11260 [Mesorhizobium japonicum]RXT47304.1 hypothetical protein B5V01_12115 [Mesorhizobium erdmanii]
MTKIALTAAAILVATSTAFAGSDNYGSNNVDQPVASQSTSNIDTTHTGSVAKSVKTQGDANANVPAQSGQGIWGR